MKPATLKPALKPADIVLVQSDGFAGWLIRQRSRLTGERPTRANHVAMVVGTPDLIIDAQPPRVTVAPLVDTYGATGDRIGIYRARALSDEQRRLIATRALKYDAKPYGYGKIVLHALALSRFAFTDGYPDCGYLVARSYQESVGWGFGKLSRATQPDDIDDHIFDNPHLYATIRMMMPLEGDW